jgi:hypothetical protein
MLSGKLPTASLEEPDEPPGPVGPPATPAGRDRRQSREEPTATERAERLAAENERLRDRVERERERRKAVVERYERLLDRRDATSAPNGRKRASAPDGSSGDSDARSALDALRAWVDAGTGRLGRLFDSID